MPYSIEKDYFRFEYPEGGGFKRIVGDFTNLIENPKFPGRMNALVDLRSLPGLSGAEDMRKLASTFGNFNKHIGPKISFIVKSQVEFGMMRLFSAQVKSYGLNIGIFETEEEAISWLNE